MLPRYCIFCYMVQMWFCPLVNKGCEIYDTNNLNEQQCYKISAASIWYCIFHTIARHVHSPSTDTGLVAKISITNGGAYEFINVVMLGVQIG